MPRKTFTRCRSPIVLIAVFLAAMAALPSCSGSTGGQASEPDASETSTEGDTDVAVPDGSDVEVTDVDGIDVDGCVIDPNDTETDTVPMPPEKSHGSLGAPAESLARGTTLRLRGKLTPGFSAPKAIGTTYTLHHLSLQR